MFFFYFLDYDKEKKLILKCIYFLNNQFKKKKLLLKLKQILQKIFVINTLYVYFTKFISVYG